MTGDRVHSPRLFFEIDSHPPNGRSRQHRPLGSAHDEARAQSKEPWVPDEMTAVRIDAGNVRHLDDLLVAVGEHNRAAFVELYRASITRIRATIRRTVIDPVHTEDIVQDFYFEIWLTAYRFDPAQSPAIAWMVRLAHARAVDRVRRLETSKRREGGPADRSGEGARDFFAESDDRDDAAQRIHAGMPRLSVLQRQALRLIYVEGNTNAAAAQTLGITTSAFKSRLRDGVVALRQLLTAG